MDTPTPIGIAVPMGGSNCAKCEYIATDTTCKNPHYIAAIYKGKKSGEARFIDGKTGKPVTDKNAFCCNFYDW